MARRSIDEVLQCLRIAAERHLSKRRHRQQSPQSIKRLLFQYRILFLKIFPKPALQWRKQRNIGIEQAVHHGVVFAAEAVALEIRFWSVIKIAAANLGPEV